MEPNFEATTNYNYYNLLSSWYIYNGNHLSHIFYLHTPTKMCKMESGKYFR